MRKEKRRKEKRVKEERGMSQVGWTIAEMITSEQDSSGAEVKGAVVSVLPDLVLDEVCCPRILAVTNRLHSFCLRFHRQCTLFPASDLDLCNYKVRSAFQAASHGPNLLPQYF